MVDDLCALARMIQIKRAGIETILTLSPSCEKAEQLIGQYDALANVLGEIEDLHPGTVKNVRQALVAPTWDQRSRGLQ